MVKIPLCTLFVLAAAAILAGCAVYPAVQVAGHAMTGYDAAILVDEYLPRTNVTGGKLTAADTDRILQRRLRERLRFRNHTGLTAHVIDANAYLVGQVQGRNQADQAIRTAATVQGLKTITCKFYNAPTDHQTREGATLHARLITLLKRTDWLPEVDLRVVTVGTNVVLIGKTEDFRQKSEALAIASEVGGLTEVVDYISVRDPLPGDKLAGR
ncbi:MAG: BON domain-containing protein [Desulfovibrionaceae bacterium]|nr:BON domain-containing protein [Desulfovibrionaceae bacterium]